MEAKNVMKIKAGRRYITPHSINLITRCRSSHLHSLGHKSWYLLDGNEFGPDPVGM
jgi:hypothetical protein